MKHATESIGRLAATSMAVAAGALIAALLIPQFAGVLGGGSALEPTTSIAQGLRPNLDPSTVQQIAEQHLASMQTMAAGQGPAAVVQRISAVAADRVATLEAAAPVELEVAGIRWVVRATGTFVGLRVPPGQPPIVNDTGYIIIDDATGEVVGMGMP